MNAAVVAHPVYQQDCRKGQELRELYVPSVHFCNRPALNHHVGIELFHHKVPLQQDTKTMKTVSCLQGRPVFEGRAVYAKEHKSQKSVTARGCFYAKGHVCTHFAIARHARLEQAAPTSCADVT